MSEYVSIQEGNQNKAFNGLDKLETDLQSGDSCFWVPKSTRQLESISIKANGTYHPEEKYGISRASVSVPGTSDKISGKGQDGNDYTVSLDETTGNLVRTKVPSSIAVTRPPTTLQYEDGDRISFVNIEVTAYDGEGNEFDITGYPDGVIPFEELQFPVIVAVNKGQGGERSATSSLNVTPFPKPFLFGLGNIVYIDRTNPSLTYSFTRTVSITTAIKLAENENESFVIVAASSQPFVIIVGSGREYDAISYIFDNKTVYYTAWNGGGHVDVYPRYNYVDDISPIAQNAGNIAWTMIYGDISGGGDIQQSIPVNWPRYNDGKILTASFDITVSPKASTNTNNEDDGFTGHDGSIDDDSGGGGGHSF